MDHRVRVSAALLVLTLTRPAVGVPQDQVDKPKKNEATKAGQKKNVPMAAVKILISAEGKSAIPPDSTIQWEGIGDSCDEVTGTQTLRLTEATPVSLPVCKVKLTIFITGFDAKTVTLDLVGNEKKYADPIRITLKLKGDPEVNWEHEVH